MLTRYGVAAVLVIAALTLPVTPALLFAGISRLPSAEMLLTLWLGKLVKYTTCAWLASAVPEHFVRPGRRAARDELARIELPRAKPIALAEELNQRVTAVNVAST